MLKVEFIGYLGDNAKVVTQRGTMLSFNVGVSRKDGGGDRVTTWVQCTRFVESSGGNLAQYLVKGTRVFVRGDLAVTAYENRNGAPMPSLACRVQELKLLSDERK